MKQGVVWLLDKLLCLAPKEVEFTGNSISGLVLHQTGGLYPSACLLLQLSQGGAGLAEMGCM